MSAHKSLRVDDKGKLQSTFSFPEIVFAPTHNHDSMEPIGETTFDLVIAGTGLAQSLLALCVSTIPLILRVRMG